MIKMQSACYVNKIQKCATKFKKYKNLITYILADKIFFGINTFWDISSRPEEIPFM